MKFRFILIALAVFTPNVVNAMCLNTRGLFGLPHAYTALSEAMHPALPFGSCFKARTRFEANEILPGTIITFQERNAVMVFRVVALAGTKVALRDGHLLIDGTPVRLDPREADEAALISNTRSSQLGCDQDRSDVCVRPAFVEKLPNGASYTILDVGQTGLDTYSETEVPDGHVFVLGDNRDNSADSRLPRVVNGRGMVPISTITGVVSEP